MSDIQVAACDPGRADEVLTDEAIAFVADLHRRFAPRRDQLLELRHRRRAAVTAGLALDFLPETQEIRDAEWHVASAPSDLTDRRVEITGPTERKMAINALNSGANVCPADLEDANTPHWANVVSGQVNLRDAVRRTLQFSGAGGREYRLRAAGPLATIVVRPRGWHLDERHITVDGRPIVGALCDFGLYAFHNARELVQRASGPYFYLPKMESHLEARLWSDVFTHAECELGLDHGTIRATVLIETIRTARPGRRRDAASRDAATDAEGDGLGRRALADWGPDGSVQQQLYDMEFPSIGAIPSTLSHMPHDGDFATTDVRFHSAVPDRAELEAGEGQMPWQAVQVFAANPVIAPNVRTEHVYATPPDMRWIQQVVLDDPDSFAMASDIVRAYRPGQHTTTDWAAQPVAPDIEQEAVAGQDCPACRAVDTLNLTLFGTTDADSHLVLPDPSVTESLALYQDGQPIPSGFASLPLSADPASYQLVDDTTRDASWWPSSTRTHTAWTFTSACRPTDQLPPGRSCGGKGGGGGGKGSATVAADDGCSFEPLLFTRFATGAGVDDVVPAGHPASVEVDIAHQFGAAAAPITSFAAQVSFDDGTTWTDAPGTRLADGRYRLDYSQPVLNATSGFASLRVRAADAGGSAIDQTITRAYPLAVTAPAPLSSPGTPGTPPQQRACTASAAPYLQCLAIVNAAAGVSSTPTGLGPDDIRSAYNVPARGRGRTVAIVDAYDDPNAESDLAAYRAQYGLPPCTSANGCFRKVNQHGASAPLPSPTRAGGWRSRSAWTPCRPPARPATSCSSRPTAPTSATCSPASWPPTPSTATPSRTATAAEVSSPANRLSSNYYRDLHTPALFATDDYGYGAILVGGISYPAASRYTIAVGGTSLVRDRSKRGWTETAWDGATSGCSAYIKKPSWQHDQLCDMRTVAELSAVADPQTGLAVRDTFGYDGWVQVGGTSLATPIVSSLYAMGGGSLKDLYRDRSAVHDVVGGSNGTNCSNTYLCTAVSGYDGPTGLGTPDAADRYWKGS